MTHSKYLIIGGGMTAAAALAGIREVDKDGSIVVLSQESHKPYDRPPLSKQLWTGQKAVADLQRKIPPGVSFQLGRRAQRLDPVKKQVIDDLGQEYSYTRLLIATGGSPRKLGFGGDSVIYFRTLDDYLRLSGLIDKYDRIAVLGGGFIGSEIAAALANRGKKVSLIFPEPGICARLFPQDLSAFLNRYYQEHGVDVLAGTRVEDITGSGTELTVYTSGANTLEVNCVVAGVGIQPNTGLAEGAGLTVNDGIVVDARLCTSHSDIYAAGDVARFHDPLLDSQRRVEHEEAANSMGMAAGRFMAGADGQYDVSPMFYSDLFDLGYEAVGDVNAQLHTVVDWIEPYQEGTVYYTENDRIRGVLFWNVWDKVDEARRLIASGEGVESALHATGQ